MKAAKFLQSLAIIFAICSISLYSQNKVDKYWEFIENNPDYSVERFYNDYPVGQFTENVPTELQQIEYLDSVKAKLGLSSYEEELLNKHNFVVTERQNYNFCWDAAEDIWKKDLPFFLTSDLVLDAFHSSYEGIMKMIEYDFLIPKLNIFLDSMSVRLPLLSEKYSSIPAMKEKINDLDVYITVARNLLNQTYYSTNYPENIKTVDEILLLINGEQPVKYPLFSSTGKTIDFSQFTPRGHYTIDSSLIAYFKTMIWLGRTEFYLIAPESDNLPKQTPEDIQRQIIDAMLIYKLIDEGNLTDIYNNIDKLIEAMVGISDNVQLINIGELMNEAVIGDPSEMLDIKKVDPFQQILSTKEYSEQRILSQILFSDPFDKEQIKPASAFMLFGQRFLIDSYVCWNVVYDRIINDDVKIRRMLPSVYDVLYSLGNNSASDFLKDDLKEYKYTKNLAALRILIDSYDETFWNSSIYNLWLNSIRTLNTPNDQDRKILPELMQTAAWNQKSMNTQLASWSQLRHDNILYGKQSYTAGIKCSYPYVYIEPVPEFFKSITKLGRHSAILLEPLLDTLHSQYLARKKKEIINYFSGLDTLCSNLAIIAQKELDGTIITDSEKDFLKGAFDVGVSCGGPAFPNGWLGKLYADRIANSQKIKKFIVADIHTAPTDAAGAWVGWVKHVGTGPVNLGIFIVNNWEGNPTVYCGPLMSFFEYTSLNFKRLNDEEWIENFRNNNLLNCATASIIDLYSTDSLGLAKNPLPASLPTIVNNSGKIISQIDFGIMARPNPFKENIFINFKVPATSSYKNVSVQIFNINGRLVRELFNNSLQSGNYSLIWNGTDNDNKKSPSGEYFCKITIDNESQTSKLILSK